MPGRKILYTISRPGRANHQHNSGNVTNMTILALITFPVIIIIAMASPPDIAIGSVTNTEKTPIVVLSPRPPRKPRKMGQLWPITAAVPTRSIAG